MLSIRPLGRISVAIGAVQLQTQRRSTDIYDVPFSEQLGKSALAGAGGLFNPMSAFEPFHEHSPDATRAGDRRR